jgi:hypothetical protein
MIGKRIVTILSLAQRPAQSGLNTAAKVLAGCFVLLLPLVAITCSTKGMDKLYGTWATGSGGTLTYNPDGTGSYVNSDGSIKGASRFTVEKEWADGKGNTWYHIKAKWHLPPYQDVGATTTYRLTMIDSAGKRMETEQNESDYPDQLSGSPGAGHDVFTRQ